MATRSILPNAGAPVDFPGRVLPNPRNLRPRNDTDFDYVPVDHPGGGAKMDIGNAPLVKPKMDISNPVATQALPARGFAGIKRTK